jgi:hypothetical protein
VSITKRRRFARLEILRFKRSHFYEREDEDEEEEEEEVKEEEERKRGKGSRSRCSRFCRRRRDHSSFF